MTQPPDGPRDGDTFDSGRDEDRLNAQSRLVFQFTSDGLWHTLEEISAATGAPEASVSARLRDLRKPRFGAMTVERRYRGEGLWEYRVISTPTEGLQELHQLQNWTPA